MSEPARLLRLCLIGNSHLVSMQEALADWPDRWPMACTFVPFRGDGVLGIEVTGGVLRPTAPRSRMQMRKYAKMEEVDLRGFDAIAIVGFSLKMQHALTLWKDARWSGLPSLEDVEDIASMTPILISRAAAEAGLSGYLQGLTGFDLAARIAAEVDARVLLIGQPRLHANARTEVIGRHFAMPRAIAMGDGPAISALFEAAAERAAARCGARVLHQPGETVEQDILTAPDYMAGQIEVTRDGKRVTRDDVKHPNARYAALMLDALAGAMISGAAP